MAKQRYCYTDTELESFRRQTKKNLWNDFYNLLCNSIKITAKPEGVPDRWIKDLLFKRGQLAEWNNMILRVAGHSALRVYDEPISTNLKCPTDNGGQITLERKEFAWIGANHLRVPVTDYLDTQVAKLVELEVTFMQNLVASRSANILAIADDDVAYSVEVALNQSINGVPVVKVTQDAFDSEKIKQYTLNAPFIADKIKQLESEVRNDLLVHYGIITANSDKRERVQVGEMEAVGDYAYDNIYTIIDTVNRDAEEQCATLRIAFNGALDDFTPNRELVDNSVDNVENNNESEDNET